MIDHIPRWWKEPFRWLEHKLLHRGNDGVVNGERFCTSCGPAKNPIVR